MRKGSLAVVFGMLIAWSPSPAFADLTPCEPEETEEIGATTFRCEPCLQDLNYTRESTITVPVEWIVDSGFATFQDLRLRVKGKKFTPFSRKSPASGMLGDFTLVSNSSGVGTTGEVTAPLTFYTLHSGENGDVAIGNAKLKLILNVDEDGDGSTDTMAKCGVNVHVCQDLTADGVDQCTEDS